MAGEVDIISGVAQGASVGASFGPLGAVAGGIIGGVGGALSASKKKKARKLVRRANRLREQTYRLRSFAEQRNLLRQGQVQAAAIRSEAPSTGADVSSSVFQGTVGSVWSQMLDNYLVGTAILDQQLKANVLTEKAGKAMGQVDTIGDIMNAGALIARTIPRSTGSGEPLGFVTPAGQRIGPQGYTSDARSFPTEGPGSISGVPLIRTSGN